MESFNGRLRDECLNEHRFENLSKAKNIIETWRIDYNTQRPHTSLKGLTPSVFAQSYRSNRLASLELRNGCAQPGLTANSLQEKTGTDSTPERPGSGGKVNAHVKERAAWSYDLGATRSKQSSPTDDLSDTAFPNTRWWREITRGRLAPEQGQMQSVVMQTVNAQVDGGGISLKLAERAHPPADPRV